MSYITNADIEERLGTALYVQLTDDQVKWHLIDRQDQEIMFATIDRKFADSVKKLFNISILRIQIH